MKKDMQREHVKGLFGDERGYRLARETIRSIKEMDISDSDKRKIFEENARKPLRMSK